MNDGTRVHRRAWAAAVLVAVVGCGLTGAAAGPARTIPELDAEFAAAAAHAVRRAEAIGAAELAVWARGWQLPEEVDRQIAVTVPADSSPPAGIDTADERAIWDDLCAARRARAAGLFEHALVAARAHDATRTRGDRTAAEAAVDRPPLDQRSCAAVRLLYLVLRDDPDHERARAATGWVRRKEAWLTPEAVRRLDKGEDYDPAFGWLPAGRLARYRAGERFDRGRWLTAAEDAARTLTVERGRRFTSDHWEILAPAPLTAAARLARHLEETRTVWRQVFGGFGVEPPDLEKRLGGRGRTVTSAGMAAVLCADRAQYIAELERLEPAIAGTNAVYWQPTATCWFTAGNGADGGDEQPPASTIFHEAAHQLFAETRLDLHAALRAAPAAGKRSAILAGERCGFWAVEAAACYMESLQSTAYGWTVGGRDAGRGPRARALLVTDSFHVPLAELTAMSRVDFQDDARLPQLYDEIAGLADYLMNGDRGRYRESFVEYLTRVYAGTADPETLARLCRRTYAELDEAYRRHISR
jgi:hypothetical protein